MRKDKTKPGSAGGVPMRRAVILPFNLIQRARQTPMERVREAKGIRLLGQIDRCGPCPNCNGVDRFGVNVRKGVF